MLTLGTHPSNATLYAVILRIQSLSRLMITCITSGAWFARHFVSPYCGGIGGGAGSPSGWFLSASGFFAINCLIPSVKCGSGGTRFKLAPGAGPWFLACASAASSGFGSGNSLAISP